MTDSKPTSRIHLSPGLLFLILLALLFFLGFWVVYLWPAAKAHRARAGAAEVERRLRSQGAGDTDMEPTPHWLRLPLDSNPHVKALCDGPLRFVREWQEEGGVPRIQVNAHLASLTSQERQWLYAWLRESQDVYFLNLFDVEDGDVGEIARITRPGELHISSAGLSVASLRILAKMPSLVDLSLDGPDTTDTELAEIGKIHQVDILGIKNSSITDAGLKALSVMDLCILDLPDNKISDAGILALGRQSKLIGLRLNNMAITDASMKTLAANCPGLGSLEIEGTAVTDAGLLELAGLKNLCFIHPSSAITPAGAKTFQARKKGRDCKIQLPATATSGSGPVVPAGPATPF